MERTIGALAQVATLAAALAAALASGAAQAQDKTANLKISLWVPP